MQVATIVLNNFRNYETLMLDFKDDINVFVGQNAQGKTNLLESFYLLATGRSYRTHKDSDLITWGRKAARVEARIERQPSSTKLAVALSEDGPKQVHINDKPVRRLSDLFGYVNAVVFSPDDLQLVKGSPGERRHFLDLEIAQVSPAYRYHLNRYNRVLRQRNNLLRNIREKGASAEMLGAWDPQLIESGAHVMARRAETLRHLSGLSRSIQATITRGAEDLRLVYSPFFADPGDVVSREADPSWEDVEVMRRYLEETLGETRAEELRRGTTVAGPQRDDFIFSIGNIDLRTFGSQGQQRTAVLACKLAEIEFMQAETGEYPLLLLDDVMSELDEQRRHDFLSTVTGKIQTFITATGLESFSQAILDVADVYHIRAGSVSKVPQRAG